jgi:hypothetical protein
MEGLVNEDESKGPAEMAQENVVTYTTRPLPSPKQQEQQHIRPKLRQRHPTPAAAANKSPSVSVAACNQLSAETTAVEETRQRMESWMGLGTSCSSDRRKTDGSEALKSTNVPSVAVTSSLTSTTPSANTDTGAATVANIPKNSHQQYPPPPPLPLQFHPPATAVDCQDISRQRTRLIRPMLLLLITTVVHFGQVPSYARMSLWNGIRHGPFPSASPFGDLPPISIRRRRKRLMTFSWPEEHNNNNHKNHNTQRISRSTLLQLPWRDMFHRGILQLLLHSSQKVQQQQSLSATTLLLQMQQQHPPRRIMTPKRAAATKTTTTKLLSTFIRWPN